MLVRGENEEIYVEAVQVPSASYQTWFDPSNLSGPPELLVNLIIGVSEAYVINGTLELPLSSLTPNLTSHPYFTYGVDGNGTLEDFFVLDEMALQEFIGGYSVSKNTIVSDYDIVKNGTEAVLVFYLMNSSDVHFESGHNTIPLTFVFNNNWLVKFLVIPHCLKLR